MKALWEQLVHSYRREESLYRQILDLVSEQVRVMETSPDPAAILALCQKVEALMADIGRMEEAVAPAKERWTADRYDPDGQLNAILAAIEALIEKTAAAQQRVQDLLGEYVKAQGENARQARTSINASRARARYRAG